MLSAYDKETGEVLWQFNTYTSMLAPPITYQIDGTQYVSILTGNGGGDLFSGEAMDPVAMPASSTYGNYGRLLVFRLGGSETLAEPQIRDTSIPAQQLAQVSDEELARGERLYHDFCAPCHGLIARSARPSEGQRHGSLRRCAGTGGRGPDPQLPPRPSSRRPRIRPRQRRGAQADLVLSVG
jgi:hypothetical protein